MEKKDIWRNFYIPAKRFYLAHGKYLIKIEIKSKNEEKYFGFTEEYKDIKFSYYIREGEAITG
ncbi:MAG: hypothetical protein ACE5WD_14225, partial [Candidatus Aminicenantia bacterium]